MCYVTCSVLERIWLFNQNIGLLFSFTNFFHFLCSYWLLSVLLSYTCRTLVVLSKFPEQLSDFSWIMSILTKKGIINVPVKLVLLMEWGNDLIICKNTLCIYIYIFKFGFFSELGLEKHEKKWKLIVNRDLIIIII